ncbi:MAG: DUF4199 domain-containing protein [Prevotella sp.]|nr:DUF4199 domain-containing protein [Prevotella sp.]
MLVNSENTFFSKYKQLKAYARIEGIIVGVLMSICFMFFIGGFRNILLSSISLLFLFSIFLYITIRTIRFQNKIVEERLSFRRAFAFPFYSLLYGNIIFVVFLLVYFIWFDNGYFIDQYLIMINDTRNSTIFQDYGITNNDIKQISTQLSEVSPIDISFQFFITNVIISAFVSVIVAIITRLYNRI